MQVPTDEAKSAGAFEAPGFCHFPEYGEEYFRQLTAEQLIRKATRRGFVKFVWEPIPGRENHVLDCRVYARAAAAVVGLDRFRESDWLALERSLGVTSPPPATPVAAVKTVPPEPGPRPGTPVRAHGWLGRRQGNWLRGNR